MWFAFARLRMRKATVSWSTRRKTSVWRTCCRRLMNMWPIWPSLWHSTRLTPARRRRSRRRSGPRPSHQWYVTQRWREHACSSQIECMAERGNSFAGSYIHLQILSGKYAEHATLWKLYHRTRIYTLQICTHAVFTHCLAGGGGWGGVPIHPQGGSKYHTPHKTTWLLSVFYFCLPNASSFCLCSCSCSHVAYAQLHFITVGFAVNGACTTVVLYGSFQHHDQRW